MGYVIYRPKGGGVITNIAVWPRVLRLAAEHGWEPAGTELIGRPDIAAMPELLAEAKRDWDGGHCWNECSLVKAEDAKALGSALEKVLAAAAAGAVDLSTVGGAIQIVKKGGEDLDWDEVPAYGRAFMTKRVALCREGELIID
jgi:hypothetical protein